jgi:predicted metal-binding protein
MVHTRINFLVSILLFVSTIAFAQPGGMGGSGGFPPSMGEEPMGQMGQTNNQSTTVKRTNTSEMIDISSMSLISDVQTAKLIEELQKKIEKHNKVILSNFDVDKDGKLSKSELKAWKLWFKTNGGQDSDMGAMLGMPPQGGMSGQEMPGGGMPEQGMPGGMNQSNPSIAATASNAVNNTASLASKTLTSEKSDESVVRVIKGGNLTAEDLVIKKVGGDTCSGEESNFYGLNAAFAAESGTSADLKNSSVFTNADGANAVFAFGKDAKINIYNVKIETQQNSSRGLDATYGGMITAKDIIISTAGAHCAALATDRGEGTVAVVNCSATTRGEGSPGIYSTGTISADNSSFYASGSEAAVIEGKNSIHLSRCMLTGLKKCGIMLYQSFSGDAGVGTSVLTMKDSKLKAAEGPLFYSTNTQTEVSLENDTLIGNAGVLLRAEGNQRWGQQGKNGAQVTLNSKNQVLNGTVSADSISSVNLNFEQGTIFTGAINSDNKAKQVNLTLAKGCKWVMTSDSYIQTLTVVGLSLEDAMKEIQINNCKLHYTSVMITADTNSK